MSTSLPPAEPAPAPGAGRIVAGLAVMIGWAGAHVFLYYLFSIGGVLTDLFLGLVKAVLSPGNALTAWSGLFEWAGMLTTGMILAGAAGVPAGLAVIWRHRRRVLMRYFWIALLAGIACVLIALGTFISGALSIPSA